MWLPNVNKLFPRLTIRTKLAIAFSAIAALPLLVVATLTVRITLTRLRDLAERAVEHDLQSSREDIAQALSYAQRDVEFVAHGALGNVFNRAPTATEIAAVERFLASSPAVFRVRVVGPDGGVRLIATRGLPTRQATPDEDGLYYALRADSIAPAERLMLPVEVVPPTVAKGVRAVTAVAILVPVRDPGGELAGVIVGEAYAAELFAGLELSEPLVPGVTMLVDEAGLVLYHSERKRGWDQLLARGREIHAAGLEPVHEGLLTRVTRLVRSGPDVYGATAVRLGNARGAPRLTLYRAIPIGAVDRPVQEFLSWVVITGTLLLLATLGIAFLAARQFTEPIYLLSRSAQQLAAGMPVPPLGLATNDELEDLAGDFNRMATTLAEHRRHLEAQVLERTDALRRAHAELNDVVSHAADAIVVVGPDGRVRLWNGGAESLFGWTAADAAGRTIDDLLLPGDGSFRAEAEFIAREMSRHGAVVNLQTRRQTRAGGLVPVSLTQSVIRHESGKPYGQSLILRDSALQARLESQMRRSERLAAVSVMAAGLAHELNNPLAIIGNRLELMLADLEDGRTDPGRVRQDLGVLQGHVSRLSGFTRDLLRFARDEEDPACLADLADIVQRSTTLLERNLVSRNIRVEQDVEPRLPPVTARVHALETVLVNLLLNAADAMPRGGQITIAVAGSGTPGWVELSVTDTGTGIPLEMQSQIFEPFFTTKDAEHGTGLGLAVCRTIVESHGGHLNVTSEPGRGSSFRVTLPLLRDEPA